MQHLQEPSPGLLGRPRHLLPLHLREREREKEKVNHLMQRLQSAVTLFCFDRESKIRNSKTEIDLCIFLCI